MGSYTNPMTNKINMTELLADREAQSSVAYAEAYVRRKERLPDLEAAHIAMVEALQRAHTQFADMEIAYRTGASIPHILYMAALGLKQIHEDLDQIHET